MNTPELYPLRFEPIFKSMLWGGRRLPEFLQREVPGTEPIGEAWVLSDVEGSPSRVADGPLASTTLGELLAAGTSRILGTAQPANGRFPLLLKFIDARHELSVQVHPDDEKAARKAPGLAGKTEAWVILQANPATSLIYAGLGKGIREEHVRAALAERTALQTLHRYVPKPGDCIYLEAGTVHAIGADILLFEVQQTSEITYRLYDWDRVDEKTGRSRELHLDEGLACVNYERGPCDPVIPQRQSHDGLHHEVLVSCPYFTLKRLAAERPFPLGMPGECRAIVCLSGHGELESRGTRYPLGVGDVYLLPAEIGECTCEPTIPLTLLECGIP